jgi:hypothetical protein
MFFAMYIYIIPMISFLNCYNAKVALSGVNEAGLEFANNAQIVKADGVKLMTSK